MTYWPWELAARGRLPSEKSCFSVEIAAVVWAPRASVLDPTTSANATGVPETVIAFPGSNV